MNRDINVLEELRNIYTDVSEWIKFAETKHAATFAVWTALLIGELSLEWFWDSPIIVQIFFTFPIFIGMLINLFAFMPFMNRLELMKKICWKKYESNSSDNVVFYQNIFAMTYRYSKPKEDISVQVNRYKQIFQTKFENVEWNNLENDYVKQIVEVATVATIKIYLFNLQVKYILLILFFVCLAMIIA